MLYTNKLKVLNRVVKIFPNAGIILFLFLFYFSTTLYPGGSQVDVHTEGFDWINNYWCNLMNTHGMNGEVNDARPVAIGGMFVLCTSIAVFFWNASKGLPLSNVWQFSTWFCGLVSMVIALFMFTEYHDLLTMLSSVFGMVAIIGLLVGLFRSDLVGFKVTSIMCMILLLINNSIYYSGIFITALPLIQKLTFLIVLGWIIMLNFKIVESSKHKNPV